jgi:glyoxylase-like metal-dependent hydrolase (beta-lactamase superfamily II)
LLIFHFPIVILVAKLFISLNPGAAMLDVKILDLHFLGLEKTISSFLIKTSEGPVLIETGPHSSIQSLEKGLKENGVEPEDVKHVFLTHIHLDHAGAAWYFAGHGARVYVHPFGVKHLADPSKLMESARRIYQDKMDYLWGQMHSIDESQLVAVDDEQTIEIGGVAIKALHTPGHAVHHIAWQINGTLFSGDVAGVKIENGPVVPPCPPPDINVENWKNSIERIKTAGVSQLYLTHFGVIKDIDKHLYDLESVLDEWAFWIKNQMEKGTDAESMTPMFQKFVADGLRAQGLTGRQIEQYEAANPAWMSVAGLIRYWTKKKAAG